MVDHSSSNNKRIAKNTLLLYARTAVTMVISLYASRLVLQYLGVSDYGVYNVVGGFIAMLTGLAATLGGASQRFITYAIGKKETERLKKVFSTCVYIHIILAVVSFIVIEVAGIWFINCKMNIPEGREFATHFIFQTSLIIYLVRILSVPYSAATIAYEKFGFYAWNSIFESIIRVLFIVSIPYWGMDNLIIYAILEMVARVILYAAFIPYCLIKLEGCHLIKVYDKKLLTEILTFSGWNFLGTTSSMIYTQGSNLLLNIYYGVLLNAAMGITNQVTGAVTSFISNFTLAVNPQITKSYAASDYDRTHELVFLGSKISAALLMAVGFPILLNLHYILNLWLVEVPEHAEMFILLALFSAFCGAFTNPFNCLIFATGKIKYYQIACVIINVASVALLYASFELKMGPNVIYYIMIVQAIVKLFVMLLICRNSTQFPVRKYLLSVYTRYLALCFFVAVTLYIKHNNMAYNMSFFMFIIESTFAVLAMVAFIYFMTLDKSEKSMLANLVKNRLHKKKI